MHTHSILNLVKVHNLYLINMQTNRAKNSKWQFFIMIFDTQNITQEPSKTLSFHLNGNQKIMNFAKNHDTE